MDSKLFSLKITSELPNEMHSVQEEIYCHNWRSFEGMCCAPLGPNNWIFYHTYKLDENQLGPILEDIPLNEQEWKRYYSPLYVV